MQKPPEGCFSGCRESVTTSDLPSPLPRGRPLLEERSEALAGFDGVEQRRRERAGHLERGVELESRYLTDESLRRGERVGAALGDVLRVLRDGLVEQRRIDGHV